MIKDTRSKHAILIDKSIKANNRTSNYDEWKVHRSTMDYTGYDHPQVKELPPQNHPKPNTDTKREDKPIKNDNPLTTEQKNEARKLFLSQSQDKQIKDVQKRQHVITKSYQFAEYKRNPYGTDIEGIDTPDEETEKKRVEHLSKITDTPIIYNSFRGSTVGGFFINNMRLNSNQITPSMRRKSSKGMIREGYYSAERKPAVYLPTRFNFTKDKGDLFHEIGHAFENKAYGSTGSFNLGSRMQEKINQSKFRNRDANKLTLFQYNTRPLNPTFGKVKNKEDLRKQQGEVISRFSGGRNFVWYRAKNEEKFANFFQGVITNPQKAKKVGYHYNVLKKSPMFREYKRKNKELALFQIGKLKIFKF